MRKPKDRHDLDQMIRAKRVRRIIESKKKPEEIDGGKNQKLAKWGLVLNDLR